MPILYLNFYSQLSKYNADCVQIKYIFVVFFVLIWMNCTRQKLATYMYKFENQSNQSVTLIIKIQLTNFIHLN